MEMTCVGCGCVGEHGAVAESCTHANCCCHEVDAEMAKLANVLATAISSGDLPAITALMAPDVRWGDPQQSIPTCQNKQQVIRWYESGQLSGATADVITTAVFGLNILLGLQVRGNPNSTAEATVRWQVMSIAQGMIAEIRGYEVLSDAEEFATAGVSNW